jgi:hypothetical protein
VPEHRAVECSPEERRTVIICLQVLVGVGLEVLGPDEDGAARAGGVEQDLRPRRVELAVGHRCTADVMEAHAAVGRPLARGAWA